MVGILDERAQRMELTQSGQALLWGGKRSSNWQRTHDATDAAEDAEAMLHTLITIPPRHGGPGGATQPARKSGRRRLHPHKAQRTLSAYEGEPKNKSLVKRGGRPTKRTCCGRGDTCATSCPSCWTRTRRRPCRKRSRSSTTGRESTGDQNS